MNMTTREQFAAYIAKLAPLMRLAHWTFRFEDDEPTDPSAWMSIRCWESRFGATIRISNDMLRETEDNQRSCCVHELIHCHLAAADNMIRKEIGGRTEQHWEDLHEYGVDALMHVIAPFMPMPDSAEPATPAE